MSFEADEEILQDFLVEAGEGLHLRGGGGGLGGGEAQEVKGRPGRPDRKSVV